jgi:uncharacterized protein (DUF2126 family)
MKDPIVEAERMERLAEVHRLASRVHANRDRIERNGAEIERRARDTETAKIELDADRIALHDVAAKLGLAPSRVKEHMTDALVGLLVELPMRSAAPTHNIDNAIGDQLDEIGRAHKCLRYATESDVAYRARIKASIPPMPAPVKY